MLCDLSLSHDGFPEAFVIKRGILFKSSVFAFFVASGIEITLTWCRVWKYYQGFLVGVIGF